MKTRIRKYLPAIAVTLFVFLMAAVASAVPGDEARDNVPDHVDLPAVETGDDNGAETEEVETEQIEVQNGPAPESTENHGACVSKAAREGDVSGFRHGMFVSSVGQDEAMKGDCDYSAQLNEAQNLEAPRGADEVASAAGGGASVGQQKAEEARSKGGPNAEGD